jgi:mRNA-degrading endonuclease RelE of RelBE toxin-antitoxin system
VRPYKVLITHEALSLSRPSAQDRQKILSFLDSLCANPFQKGDYEERDEVDRPVQIKIVGKYALTFWADHPASEVKVVRIEKADRR